MSAPAYWNTRKDLLERTICRRQERECQYRETWNNASRYFDGLQLKAVKHDAWTSSNMYKLCDQAFYSAKAKEMKAENLAARREKLSKLLQAEEKHFEEQMQTQRDAMYKSTAGSTRRRLEDLRLRKKEQTAVPELFDRKQRNQFELRELAAHLQNQESAQSWVQQNQQAQVTKKTEAFDEHAQTDPAHEKHREEHAPPSAAQRPAESNNRYQDALRTQIEELKMREGEATNLKKEQEILMQKQWRLQREEGDKAERDAKLKRKEIGRQLTHQWKLQLQKRENDILEELEQDRHMLDRLMKEDFAARKKEADLQREKIVSDVLAARKAIDDQVRTEKTRKEEGETLFNEEAAKVWRRREMEWEGERLMRQKLLDEVMEGLHQQIQQHIAVNLKRQEESIVRREELLQEIDRVKTDEEERMAAERRHKEAWRDELKLQLDKLSDGESERLSRQLQGERHLLRLHSARTSDASSQCGGGDDGQPNQPNQPHQQQRPASSRLPQSRSSNRRFAWT